MCRKALENYFAGKQCLDVISSTDCLKKVCLEMATRGQYADDHNSEGY